MCQKLWKKVRHSSNPTVSMCGEGQICPSRPKTLSNETLSHSMTSCSCKASHTPKFDGRGPVQAARLWTLRLRASSDGRYLSIVQVSFDQWSAHSATIQAIHSINPFTALTLKKCKESTTSGFAQKPLLDLDLVLKKAAPAKREISQIRQTKNKIMCCMPGTHLPFHNLVTVLSAT